MTKSCWHDINLSLLATILDKTGYNGQSRVASFSIYNINYTRSESIHAIFNKLGVTYDIINYSSRSYLYRYIISTLVLLWNIKKYDIIFVHFRGFEIMPVIWLIGKLFKKKVIFDYYLSIWDTLCYDRSYFDGEGLIGKVLKSLDKILVNMPEMAILDTKSHLDFFINEIGLDKIKGAYLYVGCNEDVFLPKRLEKFQKFTIFWYGNAQPIHGVPFILNLAKSFETDNSIKFLLVGPIRRKLKLNEATHKNIQFIDWINYCNLPDYINKSHICIGGHFSTIGKAQRVIAGKSFQFVSCGIPTILADNKGNREIFGEGMENIFFSEIGNIDKIHNLILKIKNGK